MATNNTKIAIAENITRLPRNGLIDCLFSPLTIIKSARAKLTKMNISSSTKTNLTMNGVVTGNPLKRYSLSIGLFILITVALFSLLVKLGFWQLSRAEQKTQWQQTLSQRQQANILSFSELLELYKQNQTVDDEFSSLSGYQLTVTATPVSSQILLLDNQVYQGQVGYLAFQLLQVSEHSPWLLLELGFVIADKNRQQLPAITPLAIEPIELTGRIYQKQLNRVSDDLMPEQGNPLRFQNLNAEQMSKLFEHPILATVLQPYDLPHLALPHPWKPIPLSAQKHQGYALQWFTMALVFLGLMSWIAIRFIRRNKHSSQSAQTLAANDESDAKDELAIDKKHNKPKHV